MFDNELFENWLTKQAEEVMTKIGNGHPASTEEMIILVLKAQSNHFIHLDKELRGDMQTLREDMHRDMQTLREDMNRDMQTLREDMNRDIQTLREDMNSRFGDLIHYVDKRFSSMQWTMGIGFTIIVIITTLFKFIA